MWSFVWRDLITELSTDHRCVTLDVPATGLSAAPGGRLNLETAADAIRALVESLDLNDITLVAHDLGGPAAAAAAARWPHRVSALVAINTFAWRQDSGLLTLMLRLMGSAPVRMLDVATGALPAITSTSFGVGRHMDNDSRRAFRRGVNPSSFHAYIRGTRNNAFFRDVESGIAGLTDRPLVTVFGERNDPGHFQRRWRALIPHAHQVVVPRGNHFPMCDDPALVADAIRQLRNGRTGSSRHGDATSVPPRVPEAAD
jgi:haloalkane dehalogenase